MEETEERAEKLLKLIYKFNVNSSNSTFKSSAEVDEIHMKFEELKIAKIIKENWRIHNSRFQNLLHGNNDQNSSNSIRIGWKGR